MRPSLRQEETAEEVYAALAPAAPDRIKAQYFMETYLGYSKQRAVDALKKK